MCVCVCVCVYARARERERERERERVCVCNGVGRGELQLVDNSLMDRRQLMDIGQLYPPPPSPQKQNGIKRREDESLHVC